MNYDLLLGASITLLILGIMFKAAEKDDAAMYKAEKWFNNFVVGVMAICFSIAFVVTVFVLMERECKQGRGGCEMTIQEHPDFVRK